MLTIKINNDELRFLTDSNLDTVIKDDINRHHIKEFDTVFLNVERPVAEQILGFLGDELMRIGIGEDDEPNEFGLILENIIDKFSREVYNSRPSD
jgi:hypothetical protein